MIRCQDHGAGRKTVSPSREPEGDTLRAPRDGDSTRARSTSYTPQPCVVETFCGPHAAHRVHGYVCDLLRVHPYPTHRTEAQAMPRGVALACAALLLLLLLLAPSTSAAAAVRPDKTPRARAAVVDAGGNHAFEPTVAVGDLEHVQAPRKLQHQGTEHRKPNPVRRRMAAEPAHGHMVGTYAHGKARRAAGGSTHARPSRKTPATTGWLHAAAEYLGLGTTADAVGSIGRGMVPPHTVEALREWPQAIRGIRALARAVWVTDDAAYAAAVAADRDIGTAPSSRWDAIDAKAPMPDHYRRLYNVGDTPDDVSDAPRRLEGNCGVGKPATTQVTVYRCDGVEVCVCVAVAVAVAVAVWLWLWLLLLWLWLLLLWLWLWLLLLTCLAVPDSWRQQIALATWQGRQRQGRATTHGLQYQPRRPRPPHPQGRQQEAAGPEPSPPRRHGARREHAAGSQHGCRPCCGACPAARHVPGRSAAAGGCAGDGGSQGGAEHAATGDVSRRTAVAATGDGAGDPAAVDGAATQRPAVHRPPVYARAATRQRACVGAPCRLYVVALSPHAVWAVALALLSLTCVCVCVCVCVW